MPLQNATFQRLAHREDLPRGEKVKRLSHTMGRFDEDVGIVMKRVIGNDHHPRAAGERMAHVLGPFHVEPRDPLSAFQLAPNQWPPQLHQPGGHFGRPPLGRRLEGLAVHRGGSVVPERGQSARQALKIDNCKMNRAN
jgi:hypothetical protein